MLPATIPYSSVSITATAVLVHGGSTRIYKVDVQNKDANQVWLQMFNAAAAADVTLGSTAAKQRLLVPLGDGTNYSANTQDYEHGMLFDKGLVIAVTTTATGSTASASNAIVNISHG